MEKKVEQLTWNDLLNIFKGARSKIVLIIPSIHEEWATALLKLTEDSDIKLWICLDNSEEAIRQGYGDLKAISMLKSGGAYIKQCKNLKINFISIDGVGRCLFLESRIISGNPEGYNSIQLSREITENIEQSFFEEKFSISNAQTVIKDAGPLDTQALQTIDENLKSNPIVLPDLRRKISVYNNNFQFVELSLVGGNIVNKTVIIPSSALPYKNAGLKEKMKTRFNLFEKKDTDGWSEVVSINKELDKLREDYLKPCSVRKGKRILVKTKKEEFLNQLKQFDELLVTSTDEITRRVQESIVKSEMILKKELEEFFEAYPPPSIKGVHDLETKKHLIDSEIYKILSLTKFPRAYHLVEKIKLERHFYDLTWEDLKDEELIDWFKAQDLISPDLDSKLAAIGSAYEEIAKNSFDSGYVS